MNIWQHLQKTQILLQQRMQAQSDIESNMEEEQKQLEMLPEEPEANRNLIQDENQDQQESLDGQELQIQEEQNEGQMQEEEQEEQKKQNQPMEGQEPQAPNSNQRQKEDVEAQNEAKEESIHQNHQIREEQQAKEEPKQMQIQQRQQAVIPELNPQNHEQNPDQEQQAEQGQAKEGQQEAQPQQEQDIQQQQIAPQHNQEQQNEEIEKQKKQPQQIALPEQIPLPQPEQLQLEQIVAQKRQIEELQRANLESQKIQEYIHKIQRQLISSNESITHLTSQLHSIRKENSTLRGYLDSSRQSSFELRKKKLQVELERTKLMKECQKLRKENEAYSYKMNQVQAIGDVFLLKNTLEQLRLLSESQKREIDKLKAQNQELNHLNKVEEHIQLFRKYQEREVLAIAKLQVLSNQNQHLNSELQVYKASVPHLQQQLLNTKKKMQELQSLNSKNQECIIEWQQKWLQFQSEREANRKARQLEQSIISYESQKNINQNQQLKHLNILSDREEKNILMREYLILESKNKQLTYDLEQLTIKLRRLQRQQSKVHANYIKKKQYMDLTAKYNKAKECLQGTFKQLRQYRSQPHNQSIAEEVNELLEGVQARQCQIFIQNTNQIVANLHEQVNAIEQKSLSNDLQLELADSQSTINTLRKEISYNQKLLKLMNDDIHLKNKLIKQKNEIINTLRRKKNNDEGQSSLNMIKIQSQIKGLKQTLSIYETQNIILVKEIASLNSQVCHWKHLYEQIKDNLTEKITLSMESKGSRHLNEKMLEEQPQPPCKQCQIRKLSLLQAKDTESQQTQTQNLYEYYYKQIKDYLHFLKKTSKEYDTIPKTAKDLQKAVSQIKDRFISEFKEKFEKIQSVYRAKVEEVRKEKSENQSWRNRAREDIREEFQDIRQLVINNRLINALRQAKNLIDYLEKQVENHEQNQEEMQQQGVISQEKKNE